MRNYYYRATICNLPEIPTDNRLALGVKCASCLIKNQKRWIGNQRPSDCQPLFLPTRKVLGILLEQRIEAPRQALYELVGTGQTCGLGHLFEGRVGLYAGDVLTDGATKQKIFLQY